MAATMLMIDDDVTLLRLMDLQLTREGYRFVSARHGVDGLVALGREKPDLVLLDITMPTLDGWETCRLIREVSTVPIIFLTARDDERDKARGLDLGADDYLTKPFGFVELLARIRAVLRRSEPSGDPGREAVTPPLQMGALVVDLAGHQVTLAGQPVALTPTEFRLLAMLLRHPHIMLTHSQLLGDVWGDAYSDATELLKPAISRLRQKVEVDPAHPTLIQTVYGVGYRLVPPTDHD